MLPVDAATQAASVADEVSEHALAMVQVPPPPVQSASVVDEVSEHALAMVHVCVSATHVSWVVN